jgi:hypothetical protein
VLSIATGSLTASAGVSPGATTRMSVDDDGREQVAPTDGFFNYGSHSPSVSSDGEFVAFETFNGFDLLDASNDRAAGNPEQPTRENDVYVRDRKAGGHLVLITRGEPPPVIGFRSMAAAFVDEAPTNGDSGEPSISANGRYVAFSTEATNLPAGNEKFPGPDPSHFEIVVCDRDPDNDGVFDEHFNDDPTAALDYIYTVVSFQKIVQPPAGEGGVLPPPQRVNSTTQPSLTVNGSTGIVAYTSKDFIPGVVTPPSEVLVSRFSLNPANGRILPNSLVDVSASASAGRVVPGSDDADSPALSRDGTHVAMAVDYHVTDPAGSQTFGSAIVDARIVRVDGLGVDDHARLDVDALGQPLPGFNSSPAITGNGSKVAFEHSQSSATEIQVVDRDVDGNGVFWPSPGIVLGVTVASRNIRGELGNGFNPALSADGRYIAFSTSAADMHNGVDDNSGAGPCNNSDFAPSDSTNCSDIVVRDLIADTARERAELPRLPGELASPGRNRTCVAALPPDDTCEGDGFSRHPVLTDIGGIVAYDSSADDLVGPDNVNLKGDTNTVDDVFVREFQPTVTGAAVDFHQVDLGSSSTKTASLQHVGFGPVTVGATAISTEQDHNDFTVVFDCVGTTIHEDETCGILVRYTPSVTGERHATLTVTAVGRAPVQIALTGGVGVPPDGFTATPNPLPFTPARLALSRSGPGIVTIRNLGRLPFTIDSLTRPGGTRVFQNDYVITQDNCLHQTLAGGGIGSCTITVIFIPHGSGRRDGALQLNTIQDGVLGSIPHVIGLTGTGVTPALQVNPGVVPSGRVTSITGVGFAPNHPVVLTIDGLPGTLTATTLADGTFSIPFIVFPHSTTGTHTVTATVPGTTLKATGPVLITLGSGQPPGFEIRR